jgi:5-methylcytosine-specific restriction endonuclease McrA
MQIHSPDIHPIPNPVAELDRLGDAIAELSAHLEAATARLLDLIRDFDARGGWNTGFRSCAAWLSWRVGLDLPLHVHSDDDGTVVLRGRLSPEVGALLLRALAAARETLYQKVGGSAEPPTMAQRQADALALLAETALHHLDPGAPGERYQVVVHVDAAALVDPDQPGQSVLEDGPRVSAETSRRLACDASRVVMRHDEDGRTVEVGARTRTIPPALRRALHHRDGGCRFPGCGLPFGHGHHVRHWAQGGSTTLSNLALLCRRHHRAVHEEGYQVGREPDGELWFRRPDGRVMPEVPPSAAVPADPVQALQARHDTQGLRLHSRTTCPSWLGEPLDVGWAIDVLHPLATHEAYARGVQFEGLSPP